MDEKTNKDDSVTLLEVLHILNELVERVAAIEKRLNASTYLGSHTRER